MKRLFWGPDLVQLVLAVIDALHVVYYILGEIHIQSLPISQDEYRIILQLNVLHDKKSPAFYCRGENSMVYFYNFKHLNYF